MTTFLQLHVLTSYPASNLNRDDTGRPKTVVFGGKPRLRISSQSLKRAWRTSSSFAERVRNNMGIRTQRIGEEVQNRLLQGGMEAGQAKEAAAQIAAKFGKVDAGSVRTKQIVFISQQEWDRALQLADRVLAGSEIETGDLDSLLQQVDSASDIAMFGRMLADEPGYNREASVQVAHAFTTHAVVVEDDYYVAVDDLNRPADGVDKMGTSFIGAHEYAAGVYYIYCCVDTDLLVGNLAGDRQLAADSIEALLVAAMTVSPRGKQNSYASRARASYVLAERGSDQPRSLATAFLKPIVGADDLLEESIAALAAFRQNLNAVYGTGADATAELVATASRAAGSAEQLCAFVQDTFR